MRRIVVVLALVLVMVPTVAQAGWIDSRTKTFTTVLHMWQDHRDYAHNLQRMGHSSSLASQACAQARRMAARGSIYHNKIVPVGTWAWLGQVVGVVTAGKGTAPLFQAYHNSIPHRLAWQYPGANLVGDCAYLADGKWWHVANMEQRV